jgi:hypothetical protein
MKKKKYLYLVSYFHQMGSGSAQLYRRKKINNLKEFNEVRNFIEQSNNLENVAIINIMLLGKERL